MAAKHTLRILVVDHDEDAVKATTSMLEYLGYTVQGERESLRALRAFSKDPAKFDLAIIEPTMPKLMGVELAKRLRRLRRDFPVVLYAGYVAPPLKETIKAARLGRTVFKPLSLHELGDVVRRVLHRDSRVRRLSSSGFADCLCCVWTVIAPMPWGPTLRA